MSQHIGPQTSGQAHPNIHAQRVPADHLEEVKLIDVKAAAAAGSMSVSWWHERVAAGDAPQPVHRAPRCTRWRLTDVREFWLKFAEEGASDTEAATVAAVKAKKASAAARAKRSVAPAVVAA